jgi:hypothetical protein
MLRNKQGDVPYSQVLPREVMARQQVCWPTRIEDRVLKQPPKRGPWRPGVMLAKKLKQTHLIATTETSCFLWKSSHTIPWQLPSWICKCSATWGTWSKSCSSVNYACNFQSLWWVEGGISLLLEMSEKSSLLSLALSGSSLRVTMGSSQMELDKETNLPGLTGTREWIGKPCHLSLEWVHSITLKPERTCVQTWMQPTPSQVHYSFHRNKSQETTGLVVLSFPSAHCACRCLWGQSQ